MLKVFVNIEKVYLIQFYSKILLQIMRMVSLVYHKDKNLTGYMQSFVELVLGCYKIIGTK